MSVDTNRVDTLCGHKRHDTNFNVSCVFALRCLWTRTVWTHFVDTNAMTQILMYPVSLHSGVCGHEPCGHTLWTHFVDTNCGHELWTQAVDTNRVDTLWEHKRHDTNVHVFCVFALRCLWARRVWTPFVDTSAMTQI